MQILIVVFWVAASAVPLAAGDKYWSPFKGRAYARDDDYDVGAMSKVIAREVTGKSSHSEKDVSDESESEESHDRRRSASKETEILSPSRSKQQTDQHLDVNVGMSH